MTPSTTGPQMGAPAHPQHASQQGGSAGATRQQQGQQQQAQQQLAQQPGPVRQPGAATFTDWASI
ncbi:hypothetical protein [Roseicyclus amphidinii]|uniref:hypothetical protein n=1 Tax=Roseicyclus amphidinii TaxID=3034232 RepID=UPI0024E13601|nr:hypothetical protein [Roseicyclus sp. Amp-Y-6]